jgi:hypothetical protein
MSNNMHSVKTYINSKYQTMKSKNIFQRIQGIIKKDLTSETLEKIDQDIVEISLKAERKVKRNIDNGWSTKIPKLKEQLKKINICCCCYFWSILMMMMMMMSLFLK